MTQFEYQLIQKSKVLIAQAERHFKRTFPMPSIEVSMRGKAAGKALLQSNEIKLNKILAQENPETFINEVLPHELAHLITYQIFGRVPPHGKEWQSVMYKVFNLTPSRTHTMDVTSVQGKSFEYQCLCSLIPLSIHRHNRVIRGESTYSCRKCRQALTFTGKQLS
jgi:SprT protein